MTNLEHPKFLQFVKGFEDLVGRTSSGDEILADGRTLLQSLIAEDNWLPENFAEAGASSYRQYLLHLDPEERFSVVSFVWGPGQKTPIHNHTVWGLVGMLRGEEIAQEYAIANDGTLKPDGQPVHLKVGEVDAVSPTVGDLHSVENALTDKASISIHVYGANIGRAQRSSFHLDGSSKVFVSGYTNA
jgi:predicted metal-dependent enzyme (double-stranded beta helix superfamily)